MLSDLLKERMACEGSGVRAKCIKYPGKHLGTRDADCLQAICRSLRKGPICSQINWKNKRSYNVPSNTHSPSQNHLTLISVSDFELDLS